MIRSALMNRLKATQGSAALVLAISFAVLSSFGGAGLYLHSRSKTKASIDRLDSQEGFYASEMAATSAYWNVSDKAVKSEDYQTTLEEMGTTFHGEKASFPIQLTNMITLERGDNQGFVRREDGVPVSGNETVLYDVGTSSIRRYSGNLFALPPSPDKRDQKRVSSGLQSTCGKIKFAGPMSSQACLEKEFISSDEPKCTPIPNPTTTVTLVELGTSWASPDSEYTEVMHTPVVGRLKPNENLTVLAIAYPYKYPTNLEYAWKGQLFAIDPKTGSTRWRTFGRGNVPIIPTVAPAIGDLNNDGTHENWVAVVDANHEVEVFDANGNWKWTGEGGPLFDNTNHSWPPGKPAQYFSDNGLIRGPSIADIDGDGCPEIQVGYTVFNASSGVGCPRAGSVKFRLNGFTGVWQTDESSDYRINDDANSGPGTYTTILYDLDNDGQQEIISTKGIHSGSDGTFLCRFSKQITGLAAARMRKADPFVTVIGHFEDSDITFSFHGYHYDPAAPNPTVCVEDFRLRPGGAFVRNSAGDINIANFKGGDSLQFGTASYDYYLAFDPYDPTLTEGVMWASKTQDHSSAATGSTAFDFNGDGKTEIAYNDEQKLRIYQGDSTNPAGNVLWEVENPNGTLFEYPVVVDLMEDGHAVVIVSSNSLPYIDASDRTRISKGVRFFTAPKNDFIATRKVWNQYAYDAINVNDDGTVVNINKQNIWSPWYSSEHFVGFRNNIPMPDPKSNACGGGNAGNPRLTCQISFKTELNHGCTAAKPAWLYVYISNTAPTLKSGVEYADKVPYPAGWTFVYAPPKCQNTSLVQGTSSYVLGDPSVTYEVDSNKNMFLTYQGNRYQIATNGYAGSKECKAVSFNYSPLVIDFEDKGITLTSPGEGPRFDLAGLGKQFRFSWPKNSDSVAFLAYDRNRNGQIDGVNELFGDNTVGLDEQKSANGFEALAKYDLNHDGKIDKSDPIYSELSLWFDQNKNGTVEKGELVTLKKKGLKSIRLQYNSNVVPIDQFGNYIGQDGTVEMQSGVTHRVYDIWLVPGG